MNKTKVFAPFLVFWILTFCGCSSGVALSQRGIVKAVFADKTITNYVVGLVIVQGSEKEAGKEEISLQWGEGETLAQAIQQAEQQGQSVVFYGQNQLLFAGKQASQKGLGKVLDYFGTEQASRPNMAVYATEQTPEEFEEWTEQEDFFQQLNGLEKDLEKSHKQARMIYELNTGEQKAEGLVPFLDKKENGTDTSQLVLYDDDTPILLLKENQAQLARLLLGTPVVLEYVTQYQGNSIGYSLQTPRITHEIQLENGKPILHLTLQGSVRGITAATAQMQAQLSRWESRKELSQKFSQQISSELQQLLQQTWQQGLDPFGFGWWFGVWNNQWYQQNSSSGALWQYPSVVVEADVEVV